MILSSVLLIIIAGALTFASVSLMQSRSTRLKKGGAVPGAASASPTASPVFVGTEHPVPVDPTVEKNARREVESLSKAAREKLERARMEAERDRAHVEYLYQKRLISEEAYKKGQAGYQQEIAKYEDQIANYRRAAPKTGASD